MGVHPAQEPVFNGYRGSAISFDGKSNRLLVQGKEPLPSRAPRHDDNLQSILWKDNRQRVVATDASPWRMICALRIRFPDVTMFGTGWCAGPNLVVTAAHCLFQPEYGGWATKVQVIPGCDDAPPQFGTAFATDVYVADEWLEDQTRKSFDFGAIRTDRPTGDEVGWFGMAALDDQQLRLQRVNLSGYPAEEKKHNQQWFMANRIASLDAEDLFYEIDTWAGQSGSPIWVQDPALANGEATVVGMHAYGAGSLSIGSRPYGNSGPRLRSGIIDRIRSWRADAEAARG